MYILLGGRYTFEDDDRDLCGGERDPEPAS